LGVVPTFNRTIGFRLVCSQKPFINIVLISKGDRTLFKHRPEAIPVVASNGLPEIEDEAVVVLL
jgi:hypothetical protein